MSNEFDNIEIREYANGMFQVWRGNMVLRPGQNVWLPSYQSDHDFMFFYSKRHSEKELKKAIAKETVVKTHKVTISVGA